MDVSQVVVLGGGPAGTAAAVELRRRGIPVVVFERSHYERLRIGETVPSSARQLIAELGLPESLLSKHSLECHGIWSAWGSGEVFEKSFIFSPYGHGWHVNRRKLDESLAEAAGDLGARILLDSKIISVERTPHARWQLTYAGGLGVKECEASFLIDASGRASWLGRRMAACRVPYDQMIGIAQIFSSELQENLKPVTLVESVENGWWYSAPLPASDLMVVYLTDRDLHRCSRNGSNAWWMELLRAAPHTMQRVAGLLPSGHLMTFMADTYLVRFDSDKSGWVNVGAAAIGLDPLSSDGICFALQSGRNAANAVIAHLGGDGHAIAAYALSLDQYFDKYLLERSDYYSAETRWPYAPFWSRRHGLPRP